MNDHSCHSGSCCQPRAPEPRNDFLLEMYRQTSVHLGRHIAGVWQCVGVIGGALAVLALDKDKPLNDYACSLVVILCGWFVATTLDASNWFNRNLMIIGNIERIFLVSGDARIVHPFFLKHRPAGKIAEHFKIQLALGVAIGILVLLYHFEVRVKSGFDLPISMFDFARASPYIVAMVVGLLCYLQNRRYITKDKTLQELSPGTVR